VADSVGIQLKGDIGAGLHKFAAELRAKAMRPAAYAAARVLYDEMALRVPTYSGRLKDSIYHWHDDKKSGNGREVYAIGPNKRLAPHWHLVEYGTVKMVARPYIRPTFDGLIGWAMDAARSRLAEKMKELP
jgi:HK97 gp10 family phage protein